MVEHFLWKTTWVSEGSVALVSNAIKARRRRWKWIDEIGFS
uniref:Uncharacterized protein n=1 Tax=Cucumis melo TaxID=3656 RepID=A0A9I9DYM9_CUCME